MSECLRVGIACYPTLGGSGVVATELAVALAERGHCVHMFTYSPPHREPKGVRLHLVDVVAYPLLKYPPYDLALASQIVDTIEHEGPLDILHVHYAVPHAISAFLARQMLGAKSFSTITTLHGTDISIVGSDMAYATVTRFGIEQSAGVTAVSNSLRSDTIALLNVRREIKVIPNFVNGSVFHPVVHKDSAILRIGHASNFRAVKRPLDVIRIFAEVHRSLPCRLSLIGDGPELASALELARELDVIHDVDALGPLTDPSDALAQCDVFLLPSETESFGLSALEAMSCGVPVVASRVGGIPEVVDEGSTGYLRAMGDVAGMAGAVLKLLNDAPLRAAFAARARSVALDKFGRDRIVDQYIDFYRSILRQAPA